MRVSQLLNMNVLDVNGRKIGDVNRVVQGPGGRPQAVVGVGGFLGLGERDVAFPLDDLALRDDRELVVQKLNEQELRAMPAFNERNARDQTAQVQRFQQ